MPMCYAIKNVILPQNAFNGGAAGDLQMWKFESLRSQCWTEFVEHVSEVLNGKPSPKNDS